MEFSKLPTDGGYTLYRGGYSVAHIEVVESNLSAFGMPTQNFLDRMVAGLNMQYAPKEHAATHIAVLKKIQACLCDNNTETPEVNKLINARIAKLSQ